jgi:hypothetical protein
MQAGLEIPLGVVIAHEKVDHPWQEYAWRPVGVFLNAQPVTEWRELRRGPGFVHFHAATLPLELHRKETLGYKANLAEPSPAIYVVLREKADGGPQPVAVHLVTASPHEAEAYTISGEEIIGTVAMPEPLRELIEAFIAEHHVEEPFVKRQRQKHHRTEEHQFGQEPIDVLRTRRREPGGSERDD